MKIQSSDELYRLLHLYVYYVMGKRSQRYGLSLSSLSVAEMRFFYHTGLLEKTNRIEERYGSFCLTYPGATTVAA
jgi:hypothetical protein